MDWGFDFLGYDFSADGGYLISVLLVYELA
jgi:hypothetical protein